MQEHSKLTIRLLAVVALTSLSTVACDSGEFAGSESTTQAYRVSVEDGSLTEAYATGETGTETQTGTTTNADNGVDGADKADCAKLAGVTANKVKVSGSENNIVITKQDALSFRVTGNKNSVTVDLAKEPIESQVKAICIFIAGNQNHAKIDVSNHVGGIYIIARGNKSNIEVSTLKGAVIDSIVMDAKGNGASLAISGEGKYPCDKSNSNISCK